MKAFALTEQVLDPQALGATLRDAHSGGYVSFEGWVRNHHKGRSVSGLSYAAYPALALAEGQRIVAQAMARFDIDHAACKHRVGDLAVGDCAVWVGVSAAHRAAAFDACRYIIDTIKANVPIWKHEHYADGQSAWVGCHGCHAGAHKHRSNARYARQMALPDMGEAGQHRLQHAHVLIVGVGALGCPAARYLAGAGVGRLTLVDGDSVAKHNLHRQTLFSEADIAEPKALAAANALRAANSDLRIDAHRVMADPSTLAHWIPEADLVLDCTDSPLSKQWVSTLAREAGVPWIIAGVHRMAGGVYASPARPADGVCWNCINGSGDADCTTAGVLGPVPGTLGAMQAAAALQMLAGMPTGLAGHWTCLDFASGQFQRIRVAPCTRCDCSVPDTASTAVPDDGRLWLDLRTQDERAVRPLHGAVAVAPEDLARWLNAQPAAPDGYLLVCTRGVRSQQAVQHLQAAGHNNVHSLAGGLAALDRAEAA